MKKQIKSQVTPDSILPTQNEEWGFWGTLTNATEELGTDTDWVTAEWTAAFAVLSLANPGWTAEMIRDFLDSRAGRHFANDAVRSNGAACIDLSKWMKSFREFERA